MISCVLGHSAKLIVKRSGGLFVVEDNDRDVTVEMKVKRLTTIATFLGM